MKKLNFSNYDVEQKLASISQQFGYTAVEKENAVWVSNSLQEPAFQSVRITSNNIADASLILDAYEKEYSSTPEIVISYDRCLKLLSNIATEISPDNVEFFQRGITFCARLKLTKLFQEAVAPIFFGTFAGGEIFIIKTTFAYLKRAGFNRALYALSHYPDSILSRETKGFDSLRNWNSIEADEFLSIILQITLHLFFPYVSGFTTGHGIGLRFVFLPTKAFEYTRPFFPADWMDFMRADTELAEERGAPLEEPDNMFKKPSRSIYGKYAFEIAPSFKVTTELVDWAIESANTTISRLYDVTNFVAGTSNQTIDPIYAQEYSHSFMHVLRDAASIISEDSRYRNKATTFRIADILSAIAEQGSLRKGQDEFFRDLFSCAAGKPTIKQILYRTGITAIKDFADVTDKIYENLKNTLLESVWIPGKRQLGGISVRRASLSSEEIVGEDEFCGLVLRALRNTQHGYFTRGDRYSRPSRFLSLIDGNTPDDFPTLAIAWILALLVSPTDFVGDP
jgi:hypothetical protein